MLANTLNAQEGKLEYKYGKFTLNDKTYKQKVIKKILEGTSLAAYSEFIKGQGDRTAVSITSFISGFAIGWETVDIFNNNSFDEGYFLGGVAMFGVSLILNRNMNRRYSNAVSIFNQINGLFIKRKLQSEIRINSKWLWLSAKILM